MPINLVPCHLRLSPQSSVLGPMQFSQSSVLSPQSLQPKSLNFTKICVDLLRSGNLVRFKAPGYSMYPTILNGDSITVEPTKLEAIKVGDIVLYQSEDNLTAHRVVRIENKGDPRNDTQSSALSLPRRSHTTNVTKTGTQSCIVLRGDARPDCDAPVAAEQILGKVVLIESNGHPIDPYGFKVKLISIVRRFVSCLKRFLNQV